MAVHMKIGLSQCSRGKPTWGIFEEVDGLADTTTVQPVGGVRPGTPSKEEICNFLPRMEERLQAPPQKCFCLMLWAK
jgi:hypothetical protein